MGDYWISYVGYCEMSIAPLPKPAKKGCGGHLNYITKKETQRITRFVSAKRFSFFV